MTDTTWQYENFERTGSAIGYRIVRKLDEVQSPFQKIEIFETTDWGNLMLIDGAVMLTSRDNFLYHEMMSHPALFTHPKPARVLIIGGGDCGTLREVLRHTEVREADQVEIDERVTRVSERFFPELCSGNTDPRAHLHFADGIRWVRELPGGRYDVIIVDSTDPVGPAAGLFSAEFYADCYRGLNAGGILVGQSESPLFHADLIKSMHEGLRQANFLDVATLSFPQCTYPSGWWSATMAAKDRPLVGFREEDVENRTFPTRYYNHGIHQAALAVPEFLYQRLR